MRDDFTQKVKDELAKRTGYRCSCPDCRAPTSGPKEVEGAINVGVAAHITAASENGPRFDPSLTTEERASINNSIWLCQTHSKIIDSDVKKYTVDLLRSWKNQAEFDAANALGMPVANIDYVNDPEFFRLVMEEYKKKGQPNYFLDSQKQLTVEQRAELYDRAILSKKGRLPKQNPYRGA